MCKKCGYVSITWGYTPIKWTFKREQNNCRVLTITSSAKNQGPAEREACTRPSTKQTILSHNGVRVGRPTIPIMTRCDAWASVPRVGCAAHCSLVAEPDLDGTLPFCKSCRGRTRVKRGLIHSPSFTNRSPMSARD